MEQTLRHLLRTTTPLSLLRLTYYTLSTACLTTLLWENTFMVQLSEGPSMYPTFSVRGDYLLVSKMHRHGRGVGVGDVVRFNHPSFLGVHGAKRVLGMAGDFVCREEGLGSNIGGDGGVIRVFILLSVLVFDVLCLNLGLVLMLGFVRYRKDMFIWGEIICRGREIRGIMGRCRWG